MYFSIDFWALFWLAVFGILLFFIRKKINYPPPILSFPGVSSLQEKKTGKYHLLLLPDYFMKISIALFLLAAIDPQIRSLHETSKGQYRQVPREGAAIYLVLDHSTSMGTPAVGTTVEDLYQFPSKLKVLKSFISELITHRDQDLIGLIAFARTAQILSPLTLDHTAVQEKLDKLDIVANKQEDGSAIGYAIFKTASMIASTKHYAQELKGELPSYQIRDMAMIVISDGFQETHPQDTGKRLRSMEIEEAARFAKEQNIRLYLVSVSKEIEDKKFESYRNMLRRSSEMTGGKFYPAASSSSLKEIFNEIEELEKSTFATPAKREPEISSRKYSFYPLLIFLGMSFLFLAVLTQTMMIRRIP